MEDDALQRRQAALRASSCGPRPRRTGRRRGARAARARCPRRSACRRRVRSMLATTTKRGASAPSLSSQRRNTAGACAWRCGSAPRAAGPGTARRWRPSIGTGHSTRPATSSSRPSSASSSTCASAQSALAPSRMISLRSSGSRTTCAARSFVGVVVEVADLEVGPGPGSDGRAWCRRCGASGRRGDLERHAPRRRTARRCAAAAAPSAARAAAPAHRLRPGEARDDRGDDARAANCSGRPARPVDRWRTRIRPCRCRAPRPGRAWRGRRPSQEAFDRLLGRADARAPRLLADDRAGQRAGPRPPAPGAAARRRPCRARARGLRSPAFDASRSRSSAACACMRAGISSENSSSKKLGHAQAASAVC